MKTSQAGIDFIKIAEEGDLSRPDVVPPPKLRAYKCPAGVWTIGWGCTHGVYEGMTITAEQAQQMIEAELVETEQAVTRLVKVPITQGQFDVLVSFAYNVGTGALQSSTLLRKLGVGDYAAVPAELMKWVHGGGRVLSGLVERRRAEGARWTAASAPGATPQPHPKAKEDSPMDELLSLLPLIQAAAPQIAAMLGGPAAGTAVAALADAVKTEATPGAVAAALKAAPADRALSLLVLAERSVMAALPKIAPAQPATTDHGTTVSLWETIVKLLLVALGALLVGRGYVSQGVWTDVITSTTGLIGAAVSALAGGSLLSRIRGSNANTVALQPKPA